MSVNKNVKTPVQDHLKQIESEEGTFLNLGFWKLKEKLRPDSKDPPMAKKDKDGNLITSPEGIKNLYLNFLIYICLKRSFGCQDKSISKTKKPIAGIWMSLKKY